MDIRVLSKDEQTPMYLLLKADPSQSIVEDYLERDDCFVAEIHRNVIAVYVLLTTRPDIVELVKSTVSLNRTNN